MKFIPTFVVTACLCLAGCMPDSNLPGIGDVSRYDITAYQEDTTLSADLTGLWIAVHEGTLNETVDGIKYTMTGNIREIVEITRSNGVYYVRSCLFPDSRHVVTVSGNKASAAYNDVSVDMTVASNTAMSGTASRTTASSYSGTVAMKKVAALGETFGLFSFLNTSQGEDVATAGCFQEASLHVVGSQLMFSKWADVELANITDWSTSTLRQTGYLFSRGGTADPVRKLRFAEGTEASGLTIREYPVNGEVVTAAIATSTQTDYVSEFSLEGVIAGAVNLDMDIGSATAAPAPATAGSSESLPASTPTTSSGSYDYMSMMQWMTGFYQISLPW